jgi:hypothetical protein
MAVTLYRERVEAALPARMMWTVAMLKDAFVVVDEENGPQALAKMRELLKIGSLQPLDGLPGKIALILGKRIDDIHNSVMSEYDNQRADKVAAMVFYFLKELTDSGYLELWEGSPVAEAATLYIPMIEHVFSEERLDESAQKAARRIIRKLQERGYYVIGEEK